MTRWWPTTLPGKALSRIQKKDMINKVVKLFVARGGITVVTEEGQETRSHLIIQDARDSDSGTYTCKPSIFSTASVRLFILNGKELNISKYPHYIRQS